MKDERVDGWVMVFKATTDYEANLVRDRLVDQNVQAVVLRHRDHAFNLTVGDMATIRVLVSPDQVERARSILSEAPLTEAELTVAAIAADPFAGEQQDITDDGDEHRHPTKQTENGDDQ